MTNGLTLLNLREMTYYQRDEIDSMKARIRLLETQELPFVQLRTFDAKGDLVVGSADNTVDNLTVGSNNTVLVADSAEALGVKWATVPTAGVAANAITNAKLATMAEATVKGRANGAGTGDPVDLTATQLNTIAGTVDLTMADTKYIAADKMRARDSGGLRLEDDAGTLGIFIEDSTGYVGINTTNPDNPLEVQAGTVAGGIIALFQGNRAASNVNAEFFHDGNYSTSNQIRFTFPLYVNSGGANLKRTAFEIQASFSDTTDVSRTATINFAAPNNGTFGTQFVLVGNRIGVGVTSPSASAVLSVKAGTSSDYAAVGGVLYVSTAQTGNVGSGEDDLASFSVPANTLATNGDSIWFEAFGSYAANANNKTLKIRFGTSGTNLVFDSGAIAQNGGGWSARGRIYRTGATTQKGHATHDYGNSTFSGVSRVDRELALSQTLSGAVTLKVTGEATSNNDVTIEGFIVGWDSVNS